MENTPHQMYNFHPGSHVKQGMEVGIAKTADVLNDVLNDSQTTTVLLETMSGKGTEVGGRFEELGRPSSTVCSSAIGWACVSIPVTFGTPATTSRGGLDGVLAEFDRIVGIDRLKAIHLNDSLNPCGAHKDRHATIGNGEIGFEALAAVMNHPLLRDLPFYLETPNDLESHGAEIAQLRTAYIG